MPAFTDPQRIAIKANRQRIGRLHAVLRGNQLIPNAEGEIGINEFAAVMHELINGDHWCQDIPESQTSRVRAALVLMLAFELTLDAEEHPLSLLTLIKSDCDDESGVGHIKMIRRGRAGSSAISLGLPVAVSNLCVRSEGYATAQASFNLVLPMPLAALVRPVIKPVKSGEPVFRAGIRKLLVVALGRLCRVVSKATGWRVTRLRLQRFVFQQLMVDGRLPPEFCGYWRGSAPVLFGAAMHYSLADVERLNQVYQTVWCELLDKVADVARYQGWYAALADSLELTTQTPQLWPDTGLGASVAVIQPKANYFPFQSFSPDQQPLSITGIPDRQPLRRRESLKHRGIRAGTGLMPQSYTVKQLIGSLRAMVQDKGDRAQSLPDLLEHHEAYLLYTLLVLLIGSGLRPTHQFLSRDALALERGMALVADKGQRRPLYLHPVVVCQLQAYFQYEKYLVAQLALFDPRESIALRQWLELSSSGTAPLFISHDESGRWTAVKPAWVKFWLSNHGLFADLYALRRFVRNDLAQRNVPQFVLNAFMGHDVRGATAWHLFSPVSYRAIEHALQNPVSSTLRALGAVAIAPDGKSLEASL